MNLGFNENIFTVRIEHDLLSTDPPSVTTIKSTGDNTTLTVPVITHHSEAVRSKTKRTGTTGLGELITVTAKTDLKERSTQTLKTQSSYEMSDVTDMSSTALMVTKTQHAPQNFTQNKSPLTVSTSDILEHTHDPVTSQTRLILSTMDAKPSVSSNVTSVTQTALDSHTGLSEDHSIITRIDFTMTERSTSSLTVSNTDGTWTNASTKTSASTKTNKDVQTVLPFKTTGSVTTRTTRAITEVLSNTLKSTPKTDTYSAKTTGSATTTPTTPYTSTPATVTDTFTSVITTATVSPTTSPTFTTTIISSSAPLRTTTPPPTTTAYTTTVRNVFTHTCKL